MLYDELIGEFLLPLPRWSDTCIVRVDGSLLIAWIPLAQLSYAVELVYTSMVGGDLLEEVYFRILLQSGEALGVSGELLEARAQAEDPLSCLWIKVRVVGLCRPLLRRTATGEGIVVVARRVGCPGTSTSSR